MVYDKLSLDVEFEFDDVAILHDVSITFGAEKAGLFDSELGAEAGKVIVFADVGGDKATLKIGVDGPGRFWRCSTLLDGPCSYFFFASGKE